MSLTYRSDIDGLRAVAVGSVVLFHARIPPFDGGFIGVDVFFVISGFLITSILYREMSAGTYSLVDFYDRRIRRIFPALFVVLAVTTLLCALVLMPRQMMGYVDTLIPSALFYANIHFEQLLNYFGPKADETPLLHLWSLAVEEQFYIFFPLLLFVLMKLGGRRVSAGCLLAVGVASLAYSQSIVETDQTAAFFLLTSRAWELLTGALLALVAWPRLPQKTAAWIAVAGAAGILAPVFIYSQDSTFPGIFALPPVLGAAAIIYAGAFAPSGIVSRILSLPAMVYVGRISYSLYLWHWPLLVLAAMWKGRHLTYFQSAGVILVAVAFSALSLKYVETPLRRSGALGGRRLMRIGAGAGAILATLVVAFTLERVGQGFFSISPLGAIAEAAADDKSRFQRDCNNTAKFWRPADMKPVARCALGPGAAAGQYQVLVWGDSHAGATFIGIAEEAVAMGYTARLQTMAGCPPLIGGIARRDQMPGSACVAFNTAVLDEIRRVKPKVVVLVGRWALWTSRAGAAFTLVTDELPGGEARSKENSARVFAHMVERTVTELRGLGIQVILLGQSPEYALAPARCVATREFYRSGDPESCFGQTRKEALRGVGPGNEILAAAAARHAGVAAFLMADVFCRDETCTAGDGKRFFYVDTDHLSRTGSRYAMANSGLRNVLASALMAGGGGSAALKP
ncbi:acyltransferase [Xanthobacter dioxanivorans]|uniref:Acyltransferase n=1 Tax=Xanthobacter dioxanivorans TaxID=2528964 RepID=A0A974PKC9_9HYPH|nr:acyltransferase family protein [Xanthobacter dioxanivorans]QRG05114.1 acyltransferase [Xanthobacter dioxanivorans]